MAKRKRGKDEPEDPRDKPWAPDSPDHFCSTWPRGPMVAGRGCARIDLVITDGKKDICLKSAHLGSASSDVSVPPHDEVLALCWERWRRHLLYSAPEPWTGVVQTLTAQSWPWLGDHVRLELRMRPYHRFSLAAVLVSVEMQLEHRSAAESQAIIMAMHAALAQLDGIAVLGEAWIGLAPRFDTSGQAMLFGP